MLLLVASLELFESFIIRTPLLQIITLLSIITLSILHRQAEKRDGLGLAVTACGFIIITISRLWRILNKHNDFIVLNNVRLITTIGTCFIGGLLGVIDTYSLYRIIQMSKHYEFKKSNNNTRVMYKHSYSPLLSKLTFYWVVELLYRGYKAPLDLVDLGDLPEEETAVVQFKKFIKIYNKKSNDKISLWFCYWKHVWQSFLIGGILKLIGDTTTLIGPMAISKIINYVKLIQNNTQIDNSNDANYILTFNEILNNGYFLGFIIFLAAIIQSTLSQASTHCLNVEGIRLRTALQALIYSKSLKLYSWTITHDDDNVSSGREKNLSSNYSDIGTLTNLMSEDVYNVMSFFWIGHYIWAIPLKIIVIIYLLYIKLGVSAIIGAICCILIVTPMQLILGKKMSKNLKLISEKSDARLKLLNEILQGIKFVKLRGWENIFEKRIKKTRDEELELLDNDSLYWGLITFITQASTILITILTFGVYFWVEETHLDAGNVFSSLALFSQLTVPLLIFPVIIPIILNARNSTKRLEEFLERPEIVNVFTETVDDKIINNDESESNCQAPLLQEKNPTEEEEEIFENNSLTMRCLDDINEQEEHLVNSPEKTIKDTSILSVSGIFNINNIDSNTLTIKNLEIPKGKLTLIVGKTGSGKTSIISAIIGELKLINGNINWLLNNKKIAYVSQRVWLQNTTLRENILFGNNYNKKFYNIVLKACCLDSDVDILPGNDLTIIGDKGINLSGGQKQRVAIARAIYSNADVYIFDDPFSALDQHVCQQIFKFGIQNLLIKNGQTVVMSTHRTELINYADKIIVMDNCKILTTGTMLSLEKNHPALINEWNESLKHQKNKLTIHKTAKERWSLIRLVSRIAGIKVKYNIKNKNNEKSWTTDYDAHVTPPIFSPLKLRKSMIFESRYLAHDLTDLPVPADDWITSKKKNYKHRNAKRAISLQPPKQHHPVLRQSSTPTFFEISYLNLQKKYNTNANEQSTSGTTNVLKQLLNINDNKKITNTNSDNSKRILKKLISTKNLQENCQVKSLLSTKSSSTNDELDDVDEEQENINESMNNIDDHDDHDIVNINTWFEYLKSGGLLPCLLFLIVAFICQFIRVITDIWLSKWTDLGVIDNDKNKIHNQTIYYFSMYMALSITSILISGINSATGQLAGTCARKKIHEKTITSLLKSTILLFEITPIGKILNILSADIGIIDKKLSITFQRLISFILLCCSSIIINIIIFPWFIIAVIPICIVYYYLQKFYRICARQLQSLEGSTRGPIGAHFSETLSGLSVIRASFQQDKFINDMFELLDSNTNAFLILNTSSRWLGIALDYLGAIAVLTSIIASILSAKIYPEFVTPALVGLAINYTFLVPIYLNWVVKFISEIEMYMGSVSRLTMLTKNQQEDYRDNGYKPHDSWPSKGEIIFENVTLKYHSSVSPIIRNLNLKISPGQKLGICGKSGSGKSSTVMALFQLLEISEGRILIDGIDLQSITLLSLRSRLSAIPQDVVMFSGSIRENLDPMCQFNDDEIWHVLELVQAKYLISNYNEGLNYKIQEGGKNFSTGQLQLLCMARALLRKSNIIVIDEATSALDLTTEKILLNSVKNSFKQSTVITISHRVASLLNCDKIIVFDEGKIIEEGTPNELSLKTNGYFKKMLQTTEIN
ncbi:ATP-binding cassette sub-family C member Sur-like [Aphidius gifuensis]|uniref:ATP-binding cassette sub-family C member Sur-like n=1 Tax=Aphidius gifuensis TaxID=684658 RepID=UPI001CDD02D0|nr:ATP-binding cassette sub-family C member Sur-like [Aphidius gifuensis]